MKAFLISLVLCFGLLGTVGWLARNSEARWSNDHTERMRGSESYYEKETSHQEAMDVLQTRLLNDSDREAMFIVLEMDYSYRLGREFDASEAKERIAERNVRLRDALFVHLSDYPASAFETLQGKYQLKRMVRDLVQESVFPDEFARVDDVLFKKLLFQRVRSD